MCNTSSGSQSNEAQVTHRPRGSPFSHSARERSSPDDVSQTMCWTTCCCRCSPQKQKKTHHLQSCVFEGASEQRWSVTFLTGLQNARGPAAIGVVNKTCHQLLPIEYAEESNGRLKRWSSGSCLEVRIGALKSIQSILIITFHMNGAADRSRSL
jgi:hypothetical protein